MPFSLPIAVESVIINAVGGCSMKLISWNVNGLRACASKGFYDVLHESNADVFCIQESKMQEGQHDFQADNYYIYMNSAERKGYSGVITFSKSKPLSVTKGIGIEEHDHEGRVLTCEYDKFYLVNCYTPNSKEELARLDYRMQWEDAFRNYLTKLAEMKPVVLCGDLNVAHQEIDLKNPKTNHKNPGFSDEERAKFGELLNAGFIDTFRTLYPEEVKYSWWSYRFNSRAKNVGWRIDYFVVSECLKPMVKDAMIYNEIYGSDHCPVGLELEL